MTFSKSLALCCALLLSSTAVATSNDFSQPLTITADHSNGDLQTRTLTYSSNVVIRQGSLQINADKLALQAGADGQNQQVFIATGRPATYQQMMDNGLLAEAKANEIRYHMNSRELVLKGNAELSQAGSVVKGDTITYNAEKQQLNARGNANQQITTIFLPKTNNER